MATTYLTRTFSSPTNRKIWTWSAFVKKTSLISDYQNAMFGAYYDVNNRSVIRFNANKLQFQDTANSVDVLTTRLFRDTNAWYHIVAAVDTTQATASNRIKMYVNGLQETAFDTAAYPSQNDNMQFNGADPHYINARKSSSIDSIASTLYSHVHFCDGTQLAPTVFGETDTTTGEWKIKTDPSFTLGNNGFTILKDGNTITDQSSNSNNFTVGAGTLTKTEDSPSNVFATINANDNYYAASTFSNGNNTIVTNSSNYTYNSSTLAFSSGKYYCEAKLVALDKPETIIGISSKLATSSTSIMGSDVYSQGYRSGGNSYTNNVQSSYGSSYTAGDIIGVAIDADNNKLYFSKNGTWQNSGDPTSGATGTGALSFPTDNDGVYYITMYDIDSSGSCTWSTNFGNGYFGTTAVSSAGTNASGNGIFEYDVPTGFTALSTKGLNL